MFPRAAAAVKQIQHNKSLSDDQKKIMLQQLQASMGSIGAMAPPPGNVDAVKPYLDQLAGFALMSPRPSPRRQFC